MRTFVLALLALTVSSETTHRYLIVGSGPGSLQMAHYLQSAGRDYLVLEAGPKVGHFFRRFPAFRELISINKRHVGTDLLDLNLRHDWNSLLSDPSPAHPDALLSSTSNSSRLGSVRDPKLLFRAWDQKLWPSADSLVAYMEHFAKAQQIKVRYDSKVVKVSKREDDMFVVQTADGASFVCKFLMLGTSLGNKVEPITKERVGGNFEHYTNASLDKQDYEGKRVLILGRGNAAFEFASNIMDNTHFVHILGRLGRVRLAWETHYPGGVRVLHNQLLETYMLKAMDIMYEQEFEKMAFRKKPDGLWYVYGLDEEDQEEEEVVEPSAHGYHHVISCLGWKVDLSMFAAGGLHPRLLEGAKYPEMTGRFESVNVENLFFVGTLMHSRDFRKASGGFIHGFRYLIRALHRELEMNHQEPPTPWPVRVTSTARGQHLQVSQALLWRIDHSSGLYQMFGYLADVVLLVYKGDQFWTEYREEVPVGILNKQVRLWCTAAQADYCSYLALTLEYGKGPDAKTLKTLRRLGAIKDPFSDKRVGETGETSHFLHPILRYGAPTPDGKFKLISTMQLAEHPLTEWTALETEPVAKFFEQITDQIQGCHPETKQCQPASQPLPAVFRVSNEEEEEEEAERLERQHDEEEFQELQRQKKQQQRQPERDDI